MENNEKLSIVDLIDNDRLEDAFNQAIEFLKYFDDFSDEIYQLKAQYVNTVNTRMLGIVDNMSLSVQNDKVRYFFRKKVKEFHDKVLLRYFDIEHFHEKINDIENQDDLLLKIMKVRLEPLGYIFTENTSENSGKSSFGIIIGKSAVMIPLQKIGSDIYAMAQVLKKTSITKQEKINFRQLIGLKHRNVIKVLGCEVDLYPFFLIMEHVYGRTLGASIKSVGPRPMSQVIDWLYQLADALLYINQRNIYHFNVRPSKLYIDDEFHIMISPVNLSTSTKERDDSGVDVMNFWEVCKYGSPELISTYGPGRISTPIHRFVCASEQYSLGLIAYNALTGDELFNGDSIISILEDRKEFENNPEAKLKRLEKIPRFNSDGNGSNMIDIIRKLLNTNPDERFSSLHSLIRELHRLIHSEFEYAKTIQKSYRRALANNREIIREFYDNLIGGSDKIKEIFASIKDDKRRMNRQYAMLQMSIDIIINLDDADYQKKFNQLFTLDNSGNGDPHSTLEINDFRYFMEKLIETVSESDPEFRKNELVQAAWEEVTEGFIEKLKNIVGLK